MKEVKQPVLTAIDEPVVVGLVRFRAVTSFLEKYRGNSLRTAGGLIVESNIAERADGGVEQILQKARNFS